MRTPFPRPSQVLRRAIFLTTIVSMLMVSDPLLAQCSSVASGSWQTAATWINCGGSIPNSSTNVIVNSGHAINLGGVGNALNLTVVGDLSAGSNSLTVAGNLTVDGTISTLFNFDVNMNGAGATVSGTGSLTSGAGLNLTGGAKTIAAAATLTVTGDINVGSGTTVTNNGSINVDGSLTAVSTGATWNQGANSTLTIAGSIFSGSFGAFNGSASPNTLILDGTGFQSVDTELASMTLHHVQINGGVSQTVALAAPTTINGNLTISSGALDDNGSQITGGAGTFSMAAGTKFRVGTFSVATTFPPFSSYSFNSASTVIYDSSMNQAIDPTPIYGNLLINDFSGCKGRAATRQRAAIRPLALIVKSISPAGTLRVAGNLVVDPDCGNTFLLDMGLNSLDVTGDVLGSEAISFSTGGTPLFSIGGDYTNTGGFTAGDSTVIYDGTNQNVKSATYKNLTIANAGLGNADLLGPITVDGTLELTNSSILRDMGQQITGNIVGALTLRANSYLKLGFSTGSTSFPTNYTSITIEPGAIVSYEADTGQTISTLPNYQGLSVTDGGSGQIKTLDGGATLSVVDLYIETVSLPVTLNTGISTNVSISNSVFGDGNLQFGGTGTLTIGGSYDNTGTLTVGSGSTVQYLGGGTFKDASYHNLTINTAGSYTGGTAGADVNGTFNLLGGASLSLGTFGINAYGNATIDGSFTGSSFFMATGGTTLTPTNAVFNSLLTFAGATHTIAPGVLTVSNDITMGSTTVVGSSATVSTSGQLSGAGPGSTWNNLAGSSLSVGTDLLTTGVLNATAVPNSVVYNGGAQTVKPASYHHLSLDGAGAKTMTGVSTVNGDFSVLGTANTTLDTALTIGGSVLVSGGSMTLGSLTHNVGGSWDSSGGLVIHTGSTVNFTSSTPATIVGNFNNVTISGVDKSTPGTVQLNNLTINPSAELNCGGGTVTLLGNWTNNGSYVSGPGLIRFSGSSAQAMNGGTTSFGNLEIANAAGVNLASGTAYGATGTLWLTDGFFQLLGIPFTLGPSATIVQGSGSIVGLLTQELNVGTTYLLPLGNLDGGYAPLSFTATAVSGSPATVNVLLTDGPHPNAAGGGDVLQRYWDISPTNVSAANLVFQYSDGDVVGDENSYIVAKYNGSAWSYPTSTINTTSNTATVNGVTSFSTWTLGTSAALVGPCVVTNTNDSGAGSLRQAIVDANGGTCGAAPSIVFNIPTTDPNFAGGTFTIAPLPAGLPALTIDGLVIDGATQTSFSGDTNVNGPEIVIDGSAAGSAHGFIIANTGTGTGNGLQIRNLVIKNFTNTGIVLDGLSGAVQNIVIANNYIGVGVDGNSAFGNNVGIRLQNNVSGNTIGGVGAGNVISGNITDGIVLAGNAQGNNILGNFIGTDPAGTGGIPNGGHGINLSATSINNTIGGTAAGQKNIIAFNGGAGIATANDSSSTGNAIRGNEIYDNGGLGIDLASDGVTANDSGDGDVGPNNLQNVPVLVSATFDGTNTTVTGTIDTNSSTTVLIDLYTNVLPDSTGHGEGEVYLGSTSVGTVVGPTPFTMTIPGDVRAGYLTATATRLISPTDTSEFSLVLDADLSIAKTDSADPVNANDPFSYTITVTNAGPSTADSITVTDVLPSGVTYTGFSGAGWSCSGITTITCTRASLAASSSSVVTLNVVAPAITTTVTNSVSVSAATPEPAGATANNSATQSTDVFASADVTITKVDSADPVNAGGAYSYTITVTNNGPSTATGIVVNDTFPAGVTLTSYSGTGWSCAGSPTLTCNLSGSLASGAASSNLIFNVTAPSAGGAITNTANVFLTENDPNAANNSSSQTTTINPVVEVGVTKTDSIDPVGASSAYSYTITVTNGGPSTATNVAVTDTLPAGVTFTGFSGAGWSCAGTTTITCSLASLAPATSSAVTLNVTAPATGGTVTNSVSVSSTEPDSFMSNNLASQSTTVSASANLSLVKTDSADPVNSGSPFSYSITVTNAGPSSATNVTVVDTIPAGLTYTGFSGTNWSCVGTTTITCTLSVPLPIGSSTVTLNVTAPASGGSASNTATVSATESDPDNSNNSGSQGTTFNPVIDLSVAKTDSADPVNAGASFSYAITVTNAGPSMATTIAVVDTLPAGMTLTGFSGAGWSCSGVTTINCSLASLASGASSVVTLNVTAPSAGGTVTNTVSVSASETDSNNANNSASQSTAVTANADVSITKVDSADPVSASSAFSYTLTVTNAGPSTATSIAVSDTLPAGVTFTGFTGAGWSCAGTTTITCNLSSLGVASSSVTLTVTAPSTGGTITNNATVSAAEVDPNAANNAASQSTTVNATAALTLTKTDSADPVNAGASFSYILKVDNAGPSAATNVTIADTLPTGVTYVGFSGAGWSCSGTTTITCTLASLASGASSTVTLNVTAPSTAGTISNTASATATEASPVPGSETTTINAVADLSITKTDSADPVTASSAFSYTLTVTNAGPSTATSVTVTDTLPAGVTFNSATAAGWSCSGTTTITCTIASLPVGSSSITLNVTAPASGGTITNSASVASLVTDPNAANNSGSQTTTIGASANLSIVKTDSADPVTVGAPFSYTLTVSNAGPSSATSVTVTDTLPAGVTFVSATGTGWTCSGTTTVTCTRASFPLSTSTITINVTAPLSAATLSNTATVSSTTPDPATSNNTSSQTTTVSGTNDVGITKSGPATINVGSTVAYTITVKNLGSAPATNVVVNDPTPAGLTFLFNSGDCTTQFPCTFASIPAATEKVITANYLVDANAAAIVTNTATVSSSSPDQNSSNNAASTSANVCPGMIVTTSPLDGATGVPTSGTLTWNSTGAANYSVYLAAGDAGCTTFFGETTTPSIPYNGLMPGARYTWKIVSDRNGCQVAGPCNSFTTAGAACTNAAPTPLSPENGATSVVPPVTFVWTPVSGATGYKVFAVIGEASPALLGETTGESSTTLASDLPFGATVSWYVEAHFPNCPQTTSSRNTFRIRTSEVCDFAAPRLISPANGTQSLNSPLTVDWDGVPGAKGYHVWVGVGDSFPVIVASTTTETIATVRVPSGVLKIFVEALFEGCPPTISEVHEISVLKRANCPTGVATLLAPAQGASFAPDAEIEFDWSDVPNAIGYALWFSIDGDAPSIYGKTDGTVSKFTRRVQPGAIVWFVEVFFEGCDSTFSARRNLTVAEPDPCAHQAPRLTKPTAGAQDVSALAEFEWTSVDNADEYRVWVKVNGTEPQLIGATSSETKLTAALSGTAIQAYVEALFDGCPSTESQRVNFTLASAPTCNNAAPALLQPSLGSTFTTNEVTLAWTSVANAVGYEVYSTHNEGSPTLLELLPANKTTLTLTLPEGRHAWRVDAVFNGCTRTSSADAFFTIALPPQCDFEAPLLLSPEDGLSDLTSPVEFSWNATRGAIGYKLMITVNQGHERQVGPTTTDTTLTVAVPTGNIAFWVEAIFPGGCSPISSLPRTIKVIPQPPCDLPDKTEGRSVETISPNETFILSWDPRPGATIYEVERKVIRRAGEPETTVDVVQGTSKSYAAGPSAPEEQQFRIRAIGDCNQERGPYSERVIVLVRDPIHITLPPPGSGQGPSEGFDFNLDRFNKSSGQGETSFIATQRALLTVAGATSPVTVSISADQPWLTFEPNPVTIQPSGTLITLRINYEALPTGASNATITFAYAAKSGAFNGGTVSAPSSVSLSTPVTATPGTQPPPNAIIVPAVAHADGANSKWISDIRLTNVTPATIRYQLNFTPSGQDGTVVGKQTTLEVPPGRTLALNDILKTAFDGGEIGQGVLEIRPMNVTPTSFTSVVSSRTYNQSALGTYGQFIPGIPFSKFVGLGTTSKPTTLSIQQIAQSNEFRTNFGFVEAAGKPVNALMSVFSASGQKLGEIPISLKAGEQRQFNSILATNGITLDDGRVEVKVTSGDGKVSAYASVVDNRTGDPLVVPAVQLSAVNAAKYVVPGVADLNTAGASWRTDMRLLNAAARPQVATLIFYPQNNPGQSVTKTVTIQPGQVSVLDNILATLFGVTNVGGAVHVSTPDPTALVATARTYDKQANGTFGQFIPAISGEEATGLGLRPLQILQLEESAQFRANLGVAEVTGKAVTIEISAIVPDSTVAPKKTIQLQPNEFRQIPQIMKDLGLGTVYNGRISVKVINGSGKVTAYGSIIDNKTQDPTYVPAQ